MSVDTLLPGTVVASSRGIYNHVGILSEQRAGSRRVIAASADHGRVVDQAIEEFAANRRLRVLGFLGSLPPMVVVTRARAMLGTKYDLFRWNCDHLVHYAHGLSPKSPQIRAAFAIGAIVVTGLITRSLRR